MDAIALIDLLTRSEQKTAYYYLKRKFSQPRIVTVGDLLEYNGDNLNVRLLNLLRANFDMDVELKDIDINDFKNKKGVGSCAIEELKKLITDLDEI